MVWVKIKGKWEWEEEKKIPFEEMKKPEPIYIDTGLKKPTRWDGPPGGPIILEIKPSPLHLIMWQIEQERRKTDIAIEVIEEKEEQKIPGFWEVYYPFVQTTMEIDRTIEPLKTGNL